MLVKCVVTSLDAPGLTDPFLLIETRDGNQVQPQIGRPVYCEVDAHQREHYLRVRAEERTQMTASKAARGKIYLKGLEIGGDERSESVDLVRGVNQVLGKAQIVVRVCHDLDDMQMKIEMITPFRASAARKQQLSPTRALRLVGFFSRTRAGDYEEKQKTRASGIDRKGGGYLISQTFTIPGAELGNVLEVFIEEVRELPLVGRIEIPTQPEALPASGRYFCVDGARAIRFEVRLAFSWSPASAHLDTQVVTDRPALFGNVDALTLPPPAAPLTSEEAKTDCSERQRTGAGPTDANILIPEDHNESDSERMLRKRLEREQRRSRFLTLQIERKNETISALDASLYKLRQENRQLKKTVKYLRPHWESVEYTADEYDNNAQALVPDARFCDDNSFPVAETENLPSSRMVSSTKEAPRRESISQSRNSCYIM
ncbi:Hypothetical Protein FCC1311_043602 [Hondaea fermentalgiana]|uniref:C2 domain-containing protein n=1 Tax=Hondaea fermentalgiana TaxID=2315210 RepID=A0A2R5GAU9_9STRA|nr:Hypothetical Protein FCC1311_043602 [Hondaea fermentalgiana]|eukprot:GBG28137.1 Hypothetical Protein FCC1311_043602 [Hondaea fermentalgiana]